jgi:hypothetical protein
MTLFRGVGYDQRDNLCGIRYWKGRAAEAACTYLALFPFDGADDQGYTNGQVLDTESEGVAVDSLTVVETAGTAELLNGLLRLTGADDLTSPGVYHTGGRTKAIGLTVLTTDHQASFVDVGAYTGWGAAVGVGSWEGKIGFDAGGNIVVRDRAAWLDTGYVYNVYAYQIAVTAGGYDANYQPWYEGAVGTFIHGFAYFIKGGIFDDWTLLFRTSSDNTTPVYAQTLIYTAGRTLDQAYFRIPDHDYSAVLQPTVADWFTGPNGQSLDVHTPDVTPGGGWTENDGGNWDIQVNKANYVSVNTLAVASVDSSLTDIFLRCTVIPSGASSYCGVAFRYADKNNMVFARLNVSLGKFELTKRMASVGTVLDDAKVVLVAGTPYEITISVIGNDIQAWIDGGNRLTATDADLAANTKQGLYAYTQGDDWDNFHVQPASGYTELDECPGYAVTP